MEKITTVGVDLAKSVFSLHGVDAGGRTVLRKTVRRDKLMELIASLPPCLIGMEACGGAHEWARQFQRHGHRVGIMMARFVAPYRKNSVSARIKTCYAIIESPRPRAAAATAGW
jgi:transposase